MATAQNAAVYAKNWRDLIRPKTMEIEKETLTPEDFPPLAQSNEPSAKEKVKQSA